MYSYIYIRSDGHYEEVSSLDNIIPLLRPHIKYYLRKIGMKCYFISADGEAEKPLENNSFKVLYFWHSTKQVTICIEDSVRNSVAEISFRLPYPQPSDFAIIESYIIPTLQKIADYGSILAYKTGEELERLRKENEELQEKLKAANIK